MKLSLQRCLLAIICILLGSYAFAFGIPWWLILGTAATVIIFSKRNHVAQLLKDTAKVEVKKIMKWHMILGASIGAILMICSGFPYLLPLGIVLGIAGGALGGSLITILSKRKTKTKGSVLEK
jgi:hypothetical protein